MRGIRLTTERLVIRDLPPRYGRAAADFHRSNIHLHGPWEPDRPRAYYTAACQRRILRGERRSGNMLHLWMLDAESGLPPRRTVIVGSITLSSIIRGYLDSCFLGYKLDSRFMRRGLMSEALNAVVSCAFDRLGLHRLEANVMPENERSLRLLRRIGFREEGLARRYLKIRGHWRDHLHMVMVREDWPAT